MPQFIPLCEQKSIEEITDIYSTSTLYNLLWKPILTYSGNLPNIYFTPDGILHNIGIEYTMADSIPLQENIICTASRLPDYWHKIKIEITQKSDIIRWSPI